MHHRRRTTCSDEADAAVHSNHSFTECGRTNWGIRRLGYKYQGMTQLNAWPGGPSPTALARAVKPTTGRGPGPPFMAGSPTPETGDWPQATLTELRAKIGTWPRLGPRGEYNSDPPANSKQQHAARAGRTRTTTPWNIPREPSTGKFKTHTRQQICNKVETILCDQNLQPTQAHPKPHKRTPIFRNPSLPLVASPIPHPCDLAPSPSTPRRSR
jgi:hypothetical protein